MKKYNLSVIMKRAWTLVKTAGMTISSGLKKAWKEAKEMEKTLREKIVDELKSLIAEACDCYKYEISENNWEKYGKSRTYFSIIERRSNSTHYVKYDFGYIDNNTNNYIPGKKDAFGKYSLSGSFRR